MLTYGSTGTEFSGREMVSDIIYSTLNIFYTKQGNTEVIVDKEAYFLKCNRDYTLLIL